ncbi:MAG TPA: DUF1549 domain-containing protein, partial [Pirellulaceae bacterium]|nr:DUF1549 domain-containing protein [Pirellulaceae bacterium]
MSIECRERGLGWTLITALVLLCALVAQSCHAAEDGVDFKTQVWPILQSRCVSCHGPDEQKGGFRVDSRAALLQGGESEEVAVVAGSPEKSPLLTRVTSHDDSLRMPPKGESLTAEQIALLTRWVRADAVWPTDFDARQAIEHRPLTWAWQPVRKPAMPVGEFVNPIDAFVIEQLTARGLQMSPAADPRTFIRRLTFDLTGLPPTPEEVAEFVAACDATFTKTRELPDVEVEKLTERLLASPHYGEHWARHWLDVVRFSESDGFEEDQLRAHAWTYRDYVVQAFNQDKPYFQFVREQIAGDVLPPVSAESIAA